MRLHNPPLSTVVFRHVFTFNDMTCPFDLTAFQGAFETVSIDKLKVNQCAGIVMQHSLDYLREALQIWLAAGEKINYSAQDKDILMAIGFRPDAVSCDDNREKFTPAHNLSYTHRRVELVAYQHR